MSTTGENRDARDPNGWTLDTLLAHITALMDEKDRRDEQRFRSQEKAQEVAFNTSETLRETANEFRASINDIVGKCLLREEYNSQHKQLVDEYRNAHQVLVTIVDNMGSKVDGLIAREAGKIEGGQQAKSMQVWLIGLTVAVLGLLTALFIKH